MQIREPDSGQFYLRQPHDQAKVLQPLLVHFDKLDEEALDLRNSHFHSEHHATKIFDLALALLQPTHHILQ